jgi:putative copper export protein/mono/diheme cytochrome c family protein
LIEAIAIARSVANIALAGVAGAFLVQRLSFGRFVAPRAILAVLAAISVCLVVAQLFLMANQAMPGSRWFQPGVVATLIDETWSAEVLSLRCVLGFAITFWCLLVWRKWPLGGLLLSGSALALIPISGHAFTAEPVRLSMAIHSVHTLSAVLWVGGLCWLTAIALRRRGEAVPVSDFRSLLRRFSPLALVLVNIAIISGAAAALLQVGRPAALIGTAYGQLILVKAIVVLPSAMIAAAWLRYKYLPAAENGVPLKVLATETCFGLSLMVLGSFISQGVPGRHDDIVWPLPFRLDFGLLNPGKDTAAVLTGHLVFAAAMLAMALLGGLFRRWTLVAVTAFAGVLIGSLGLAGLVVTAYPTTYASSISAYSADRLASAKAVFMTQCVICHGKTGHGDGPAMQMMGTRAADLTAPHTGDHTAGDMYWWITHGKPGTVMTGVEADTTDQDRWDLVNYVRLLTASRASSGLTGDVVPGNPWLPSIDFAFTDNDGNSLRLRDFEPASPVLLVIGREPGSIDRLRELRAFLPQISAMGMVVIFICGPELVDSCTQDTSSPPLFVLRDNVDDIVSVWTAYRRTTVDPDEDNQETSIGHMEFLIDRFGYVRARWRTDEGLFPAVPEILRQAQLIGSEPQLHPSPDEHVH